MGATEAYLPHLDGLRAIALVGVLFFHFKVPQFQGGFAGVDVFFTLSGFLITRNILRDIRTRSFSLSEFYKRRFFRLFPASVATVGGTLFLAFLEFPPDLLFSVAESAVATLLFSSNILFHKQAGYFDGAAATKPLLHTWSLSLEEQFYLIWPTIILIASRYTHGPRGLLLFLTFLIISSFAFAVGFGPHRPSLAFYELPARIWQFAAGALTAILVASKWSILRNAVASSDKSEPQSLLPPTHKRLTFQDGLPEDYIANERNVAPIHFVVGVKHAFPFPAIQEALGVIAVVGLLTTYILLPPAALPQLMTPAILCTCVIISLPQTRISILLSSSFMTTAGRLSYSAYLLHWPLYVFVSHTMSGLQLGQPNPFTMLALTFAGAALLRRGIEEPVRHGNKRVLFALFTGLVAAFASAALTTNGFPFRLNNVQVNISNVYQAQQSRFLCKDRMGKKVAYKNVSPSGCLVGDQNGTRSKIALFGDSFTLHLSSGFHEIGKNRGEWYGLHFRAGCKFLPQGFRNQVRTKCLSTHDRLWRELSQLPNGSIVAIANSWPAGGLLPMEKVLPMLDREIRAKGYKMIIIGEPPGLGKSAEPYFSCADLAVMPLARLWNAVQNKRFVGARLCADLKRGFEPLSGRAEQALAYRAIFSSTLRDVQFVDLFRVLCRENPAQHGKWLCRLPVDVDKVIYDIGYRRDHLHLTLTGSRWLSHVYENAIYNDRS